MNLVCKRAISQCEELVYLDTKVFEDENLVVEKFIESDDCQERPFHHTTRFILFNNELFFCKLYSLKKKIKQKTSIYQFFRRISDLEKDIGIKEGFCLNDFGAFYRELTPQQLSQVALIKNMANYLKLDFGSIDMISSNKGDFVIDVNKTPWERGFPELFTEVIRRRLLNYGQ